MSEMRTCKKCGESKPATKEYFKANNGCKNGIEGTCKVCSKQRDKQYNIDNKEHIYTTQKKWREDNKEYLVQYYEGRKDITAANSKLYKEVNKVAIAIWSKQYKKTYRKENSVHAAEMEKKWRDDNKEHVAEYMRNYAKDHEEHIKNYKRQYRIDNGPKIAATILRWQRSNRDAVSVNGHNYRSKKLKLSHTFTVQQWGNAKLHFDGKCAYCGEESPLAQEHFIAVNNKGPYTEGNIIPACKTCNTSKSDDPCHEWWIKQSHYTLEKEAKVLKYLGYTKGVQQLTLM